MKVSVRKKTSNKKPMTNLYEMNSCCHKFRYFQSQHHQSQLVSTRKTVLPTDGRFAHCQDILDICRTTAKFFVASVQVNM